MIAGRATPTKVAPGHEICAQGDPADCIWLLHEGVQYFHSLCCSSCCSKCFEVSVSGCCSKGRQCQSQSGISWLFELNPKTKLLLRRALLIEAKVLAMLH